MKLPKCRVARRRMRSSANKQSPRSIPLSPKSQLPFQYLASPFLQARRRQTRHLLATSLLPKLSTGPLLAMLASKRSPPIRFGTNGNGRRRAARSQSPLTRPTPSRRLQGRHLLPRPSLARLRLQLLLARSTSRVLTRRRTPPRTSRELLNPRHDKDLLRCRSTTSTARRAAGPRGTALPPRERVGHVRLRG